MRAALVILLMMMPASIIGMQGRQLTNIEKWFEAVRTTSDEHINDYDSTGKTLLIRGITFPSVSNLATAIEIVLDERKAIDVNKADSSGERPIWLAIKKHNQDLIKVLLDHGARIQDFSPEPLLIKTLKHCLNGDLVPGLAKAPEVRRINTQIYYMNCITMLARAGCSMNEPDQDGSLPLMFVAAADRCSLAMTLVGLGASPDIELSSGNDTAKFINDRRKALNEKRNDILAFFNKKRVKRWWQWNHLPIPDNYLQVLPLDVMREIVQYMR